MLELRELKKSFGGTTVLQGVDLTVQQGDVIAVIGPSGSGKTTLLRCMNFLETADSGALTFDGETLDLARIRKKDAARLRRKTAFVFQSYNLFANKTALENVTEGLIVGRKMPKAEALALARRALDQVGLANREDHYPAQLSGRIDATLNAEVVFADYQRTHPDANIQVVAFSDEPERVAIPVRKGDDSAALLAAINDALAQMDADGTLSRLSVKYFGMDISKEQ